MKTMKQFFKLSIFVWATILIFSCSKDDFYEMDEPGLLVPRTVDEDSSLPSISVNGTMLHSEAFGLPSVFPSPHQTAQWRILLLPLCLSMMLIPRQHLLCRGRRWGRQNLFLSGLIKIL